VERDYSLEKGSLSGADVLNCLFCYGLRQKAYEIAGVAGLNATPISLWGLNPPMPGP
jgi:hypothetical protein